MILCNVSIISDTSERSEKENLIHNYKENIGEGCVLKSENPHVTLVQCCFSKAHKFSITHSFSVFVQNVLVLALVLFLFRLNSG